MPKKNKTPERRSWEAARSRCYNKNATKYPIYGGRGIKVCDRWLHSFENFLADMGKKPSLTHTLGRIDNDGNYEPSNCEWQTPFQQQNNTSLTKKVLYKGVLTPVSVLAIRFNVPKTTLIQRLNSGWTINRALSMPRKYIAGSIKKDPHYVTFMGMTLRLFEWSKKTGINYQVLRFRLKKGWDNGRALTEKVRPKKSTKKLHHTNVTRK